MSNKRGVSWKKRDLRRAVLLFLRFFFSLPCCLHVSLTKFYQVVLDAAKSPPAEPHTKTLSMSLPSPFFFPFRKNTHTHTCADTDTHTACGVVARLGPWPWLVLGLLEKDRKRNGERSWEQWWWLVPGLRGLQAVLGNLC